MPKCADCAYAKKAANASMVYCSYWQQEFNNSNAYTPEEFIKEEVYEKLKRPNKVALGWGYPYKPFIGDSSWAVNGTATEGLMLSNQILVSKDDYCDNFTILPL